MSLETIFDTPNGIPGNRRFGYLKNTEKKLFKVGPSPRHELHDDQAC